MTSLALALFTESASRESEAGTNPFFSHEMDKQSLKFCTSFKYIALELGTPEFWTVTQAMMRMKR